MRWKFIVETQMYETRRKNIKLNKSSPACRINIDRANDVTSEGSINLFVSNDDIKCCLTSLIVIRIEKLFAYTLLAFFSGNWKCLWITTTTSISILLVIPTFFPFYCQQHKSKIIHRNNTKTDSFHPNNPFSGPPSRLRRLPVIEMRYCGSWSLKGNERIDLFPLFGSRIPNVFQFVRDSAPLLRLITRITRRRFEWFARDYSG